MPTVPTYLDTQQPVALQTGKQYLTTQADAGAFGGAIGRGLEGLASGMGDLGDAVAHVQELDAVNQAKDADNNYSNWVRNAMYGDGGFMTLEGKNAVDARQKFEEDAAQKRTEFGADLSPQAAQHYKDASQSRLNSVLQETIEHTAQQRKAWFTDTSNARIDSFANDALAGYSDPTKVNAALQGGINELKQQAAMHGWDDSVFQQRKLDYVSGVTKSIVAQMAQTDPLAAQKYMNDAGGRLSAADRMSISKALEEPVLAAKAQNNLANILKGAPPATYPEIDGAPHQTGSNGGSYPAEMDGPKANGSDPTQGMGGFAIRQGGPTRITADNIQGSQSFQHVTSQLMGMREGTDSAAIAAFVKASCGLNVDPRTTPWCAAFVNGVLGAEGIKGTGSLAARSFLNFGNATNNPKAGDIVVFGRGNDPSKGHVGFFQGYDANGNIIVLGGNQGKDGRVSLSHESTANLLGFRTAGVVNENTATLPNYSPQGLNHMYEQLQTITDPKERAATQSALNSYFTLQKKMQDENRENAQQQAGAALIANPSMDISKLPIDTQQQLGMSGMTSLMQYQKAMQDYGSNANIKTDDHTLYELQTQYATNPDAFAQQDLFQYRSKLSPSDWEKVTGWRQTALTDGRKARDEGATITGAFSQSTQQLKAVGLIKEPSKMTPDDEKRVAAFQNTLTDQINEFQKSNGRPPKQPEIQEMISRNLMPVIFTRPGTVYGTNERDGFQFEAGSKADDETVSTGVKIGDVPADVRATLSQYLERNYRRKPTDAEIIGAYVRFKNGT